jgi:hypothetical protein
MEPLQTIAPALLRSLLRNGPFSQEKLECAWVVAVGPAVARVTRVRLLPGGTVDVQAGDETWRRELKRALPEISQRLRALVGPEAVTGVRLDRRTASRPG